MEKAALTEILKQTEGREEAIIKLIEEETAGLRSKNTELLGKNNTLQKQLKGFDGIDPEEHRAALEELEQLRQKAPETEAAVKAATEKMRRELEKATTRATNAEGRVSKLIIETELTRELVKHGVTENGMKYAQAFFMPTAKVETLGDELIANIGGVSISDAVGAWAKSEEAKLLIKAPGSTGGGAQGGTGGGAAGKTMKLAEFNTMPPSEQMKWTQTPGNRVVD